MPFRRYGSVSSERRESLRIEIREGMVLTDESSASSYGEPVLEIDGVAFGPNELIEDEGKWIYAGLLVAEWGVSQGRTARELEMARRFLHLWPQGPEVE